MKKNTNKIIITILVFAFVLLSNQTIKAKENWVNSKSDQMLQKDITSLYQKAKKQNKVNMQKALLINNENSKTLYEIPIYQVETTELTKLSTLDNVKSQTYIVNTNDAMPLANREDRVEELDKTYGVTAYITIYYTTNNSPTEYLLTKVSGGYEKHDYTINVTKQEVTYGCNGVFPSPVNTQNVTK